MYDKSIKGAFNSMNNLFEEKNIDNSNDEPWLTEIENCQKEIANLNPSPYYLSNYSTAEQNYWSYIPKWIFENKNKYKTEKCLDIGCAYGTLALFCKKVLDCEVYCTDSYDSNLSKSLADKYNFIFCKNNIEIDQFPWNVTFDTIIFTEVLEHLNFHPVPTLKKIYGLLNENGRLYLSTPDASQWGKDKNYYPSYANMPYPQKGLPIIDDHIYLFEKQELIDILKESGFNIEKSDYSPGAINQRHFNLTAIKK